MLLLFTLAVKTTLLIPELVTFTPFSVITQAACAFCGVKVRTPVAGVSSVISNFVLVSVWVVRLGYTYLSLAKVVPFSSPR